MSNNSVHKNLDEYLVRADVAIANARQQPDIFAAIVEYGYDETVLEQGQALLDAVHAADSAQRSAYGAQYGATAALNEMRAKANRVYGDHRKMAAIVLRDAPDRLMALKLDQRKKPTLSDWLTQAKLFYANLLANPDDLAAMERFRMTRKRLAEGQTLVRRTEAHYQAQQEAKGRAQSSTKARNAALDELHRWMGEFKTIARIALADDVQLLEALQFGVVG